MNKGVRSDDDIAIYGERAEQPERVISARTWILAQNALVRVAVATLLLGLALQLWAIVTGGPVATIGLLTIAVAAFLGLLSWGLEDPRMNGLPCEDRIAN